MTHGAHGGSLLHLRRWAALVVSLALAATSCSGSGRAATPASGHPCINAAKPAKVNTVIWLLLENRTYDKVKGAVSLPYLNQMGRACATASAYRGITHPSLPNYLAMVSGDTSGITEDCSPDACQAKTPSIFGQLTGSQRQWRIYAESAPEVCADASTGNFARRHVPAYYFADAKAECATSVLPLGELSEGALHDDLAQSTLPSFAMVVPNLCHDGHDCHDPDVDTFLARWVPQILQSASYRNGTTALVITYDEGEDDAAQPGEDCQSGPLRPSCQVFTVVIAPWVKGGTTDATPYSHYSLLRATEDLLGLPSLGAAAQATPLGPLLALAKDDG